MLSGLLLVGGQTIDFPQIWQKIEGKWSYVGQVKEKTQILVWIEEQTKTIMLANSRPEYLFKTIDPAIAPERKAGPSRALTCVFGTLFGGFMGVMMVLIRRYAFGIRQRA